MRFIFVLVLASAMGCAMFGYRWVNARFEPAVATVDLTVAPGASARDVAQHVKEAGISVNATGLYWWFKLSGQSRKIKAGSYEIAPDTTPLSLLHKLVQGDQAMRSVTLVEGWTFTQFRAALQKADHLNAQSQDWSSSAIMAHLGKPGVHPEGRFFPDTYFYAKGSGDLAVLRSALVAMDKRVAQLWAQRSPSSPLKSPDELLTLASIVEKETGRPEDRALISAVFNNRLRLGMRLQTDPTVIYGLGEAFDGNLRKKDLLRDTPWNTYTRVGLPPTPIAMPGAAALAATVQPAASRALYFVARGDGHSQFSETLAEHNRAVNKYQRGQ